MKNNGSQCSSQVRSSLILFSQELARELGSPFSLSTWGQRELHFIKFSHCHLLKGVMAQENREEL